MLHHHDIEEEVIAVTEATPLSSSSSSTSYPQIISDHHQHDQLKLKKRQWFISIFFVLSIIIWSCFAANFLLLSNNNNESIPNPSVDDDNDVPSERKDVVENEQHEKISFTYPSTSLYLQSRTTNSLSKQSIHLLGREHEEGMSSLRWGILGPGRIAHDFASTLSVLGCNITAVAASHNNNRIIATSRAKHFANRFAIPNYYGSYNELAMDPNVDIVYVATMNQNHMEPTLMMLRAGKNVLVEKPTTITYEETKLMYDEAEKRGLFLMTNHWTRFFPLVKYVRNAFLRSGTSNERVFETTTTTTSNTNNHQTTKKEYNLGRVLSMHGDFSFVTPLDPSDRFLNQTLGGGATLDVGCYLVELALLAAYEHEKSHQPPLYESSSASLKQHLRPDGIVATGHGVYRGVVFPVDVESSFSLRWSGGSYGIAPSCNGVASDTDTTDDRKCVTTSIGGKSFVQNKIQSTSNEFTMIASFQTSFRRPSTFDVEYTFERGRILINGPANCPNEMTIFEHDSFGPLIRESKVTFPLPDIKQQLLQYGRPNYPRPEGFAYVIDAIEKCMAEKGVPGRKGDKPGGCLELEENTVEEQLVTVEITETVLTEMGYFHYSNVG